MSKKKKLLEAFRKEYMEALKNESDTGHILDKYMDMETEEFDSDDLNDVIDEVESEFYHESVEEEITKSITNYIFLPKNHAPIIVEESTLELAKEVVDKNDQNIDWKKCQIFRIETIGSVQNFKVIKS